ncbi:MAG: glycoside hydrolase family 2 protein, partial [Terriglobia bacterium]
VCSNCDHLKFYVGDNLIAEGDPDHTQYGNLPHPPFLVNLYRADHQWGDLRIEGYVAGKKVITKSYSGKGIDQKFELRADDNVLVADGADTTRVVLRVTDEFGAVRPFATGAVALEIEGPAEILGGNPFVLSGGVGAVWIRAKETPGAVLLRAKHPTLGAQEVKLQIEEATTMALA